VVAFRRITLPWRPTATSGEPYINERVTNGIVEGFNNRLRMICRRAFGFHSERPVIGMLFLCCGDIPLYPPIPTH